MLGLLNHGREIRPLLNFERTNVAYDIRKPLERLQCHERRKQIRHVFLIVGVEAALNASEAVFFEGGGYVGVSLRYPFRVMRLGILDDQIKCDCEHGLGFQWVGADLGDWQFGGLTVLRYGNHTGRPADFLNQVGGAELAESAHLTDCWCDRCMLP